MSEDKPNWPPPPWSPSQSDKFKSRGNQERVYRLRCFGPKAVETYAIVARNIMEAMYKGGQKVLMLRKQGTFKRFEYVDPTGRIISDMKPFLDDPEGGEDARN